jgi:DNA-binding NtrC family response regulator
MAGLPDGRERILLVDDEKDIRDIVSMLLTDIGYEVVSAGDGKKGLGLFLDSPFNLVITDLDMPEVDGLTLASSIKERSPGTPVILITGNGFEAGQGGPFDFVMHKPFSLADLKQTTQMFVGT